MIPIAGLLHPSRVVDLRAASKKDALVEICRVLATSPSVSDPAALERAVLEREDAMSTGIGLGIAVPHAKIPSVKEFVLAVGRSRAGIDFQSLDGAPVHLVVLIAGPGERQARYLQVLASVTLRLKRAEVRRALLDATDAKAMIAILAKD
jgi:nitrogen PTS system EIIA component